MKIQNKQARFKLPTSGMLTVSCGTKLRIMKVNDPIRAIMLKGMKIKDHFPL